jgi:SulP family sulfate permease
MVLAAFLFMRRMSEVTNVSAVTREFTNGGGALGTEAARRDVPDGVLIYEIQGPFFFGAAGKFREAINEVSNPPRVLIIRMRDVSVIDSTAMHALGEVVRRSRKDGTLLLLSEVHAQPMVALSRSDLLDEIGEEQLCGDLEEALLRARAYLGLPAALSPV